MCDDIKKREKDGLNGEEGNGFLELVSKKRE